MLWDTKDGIDEQKPAEESKHIRGQVTLKDNIVMFAFSNYSKLRDYCYKGRFIKNQQNYTKTNTVIFKCMER